MIKPVNGHLLIDPVKKDDFIATATDKYQEIGVVLAVSDDLGMAHETKPQISIGDQVYFDSWLSGKFPSETEGKFYWLVSAADIKAVKPHEQLTGTISA